jgi:hypothetical protein
MSEEEYIYTSTVGEWKQRSPELRKSPTVFAIQALPDIKKETRGGKGSPLKKKSEVRSGKNWNAGEQTAENKTAWSRKSRQGRRT